MRYPRGMRVLAAAVLAVLVAAPETAGELPRAYAEAVERLRSAADPVERARAAIALGYGFRDVEAPGAHLAIMDPLLAAATGDPDATVQVMAAYSLCLLGDARGVARLVAGLRAKLAAGADPRGAYAPALDLPLPYLFRALAHVGGAEAVDFLVEVARSGDRPARLVAIAALGWARNDGGRADATLAALARDPDTMVSGVAQFTLDERRRRGGR